MAVAEAVDETDRLVVRLGLMLGDLGLSLVDAVGREELGDVVTRFDSVREFEFADGVALADVDGVNDRLREESDDGETDARVISRDGVVDAHN